MNILMVHPHDLYSLLEPSALRIRYLAKEISKRGNQVKLIYFSRPKDLNDPRNIYLSSEFNIKEFSFQRRRVFLLKNIYRLFKLAKDADVIHFQKCISYASIPCLLIGILKNKPIHYDWDDWEIQIYNRGSHSSKIMACYINILERNIPYLVDTISVASQNLKDLCLGLGVKEDRIFQSPVGADLYKFNPSINGGQIKKKYNLNTLTVLYLGHIGAAQYIDMFIRAARIVLDKKIEANFMVVGDGFRLPELKALACNLGLEGKIIFTGAVEHDLVPQYIAACDIAVACFENNEVTRCKSPLKIAEYMASGKPIVASNVGEVKNMLDGCGILTEPGDVYDLVEGIERLLNNEKLRIDLGQKARKRAEDKYSWSVTAENLIKAYELAIKIKRNGKNRN